MSIFDNLFSKLPGKKKSKIPAKKEEHASIHSFEAKKREKEESANSCKDAVSYKHIDREFGIGFLFSPERMQAATPPVQKEPRFKLGDGFYFEFNEVPNGMGGYRMINVYLLKTDDPSFRRCIVDERGMIENFPGIVEGDWKKSLEFPLDRKTQFRFWIYHYKDGKAAVEWMLQPDGRYFEDGDGFGGENCKEVTLHSYIDTNGFFTEPFK